LGHETAMASILLFSSNSKQIEFDVEREYLYEDKLPEEISEHHDFYALIEFEHSMLIYDDMLLIASKLDSEETSACRLAFYGNVSIKNSSIDRNKLKIYKEKSREGNVQRLVNEQEVIVVNLFKKDTDRSKFERMKCKLSTGEDGIISGSFGLSSKVKVQFMKSLEQSTIDLIKNSKKSEIKVYLSFKKFIFDKNHRMVQ
jgi:selenocysteine-specific elongation factor